MTYEKWKRAYEGLKIFMETYRGNTNVLIVAFHRDQKKLEKILCTNEVFNREIKEAKSRLAEILHWCPQKEVFTVAADMKLEEHGDGILSKIKEAMDHAKQEYQEDASFEITNVINTLTSRQNELSKNDEVESKAIREQLDRTIEQRSEGQYADTNQVDQIIMIQLNGEANIAEEQIIQRPITELVGKYEDSLKYRRKQQEDYFPKRKSDLRKQSNQATDTMYEYSQQSLRREIREAEGDLNKATNELADAKEVKEEMNDLYKDYRKVTSDRNAIYDKYKDVEFSKDFYTMIRKKARSFLNGFDSAKKKADYKNSDQYTAIQRTLNTLKELKDDAAIEELRSAVIDVRNAASQYLDAKNAQFRLFPSRQRIYRINYAKSIQKFCELQLEHLTEDSLDAGKDAHDFMRKAQRLASEKKQHAMSKELFFAECSKRLVKNKNQNENMNENVDVNVDENVNFQSYNPMVQQNMFEAELQKEPKMEDKEIGNIYNSIYE